MSCTLCVHRLDNGLEPACVEACRKRGNDALADVFFGDDAYSSGTYRGVSEGAQHKDGTFLADAGGRDQQAGPDDGQEAFHGPSF